MSEADLPPARAVLRPPLPAVPHDLVVLAHHERALRRRRLVTVHGAGFLVDLPETVRLEGGEAFVLADGRLIEAVAAEEPLWEARPGAGGDLARLAWHLGNRHAPCQVEEARLLVHREATLHDLLRRLGAEVTPVTEPFRPEGGAFAGEHLHALGIHGHGGGHGHGGDHGA